MAESTPTPKRHHHRSPKKEAFLAAYAACGVIAHACKAAKVDRHMHVKWLKNDPDYPQQFAKARKEAVGMLEMEARRRATEGLRRYKFHQGKPIIDAKTGEPYYELEYSDVLLIFLLKGALPKKYRDNVKVENSGSFTLKTSARIVEDDDWYKNTDRLPAPAALPSIAHAVESGTLQGDCVRQALGQNGHGTNGNGKGPRPDAPGANGSG